MTVDDSIDEEQKEIFVIPETHAVVDPRAVVVHLEDACTAHSAMVTTIWLVLCTPLAMPSVS